MSNELLVDEQGPVLVLTMNRPQARNAMTLPLAHLMSEALIELDSRSDLRAAVLTGAEGTFCAGQDLKAILKGERAVVEGRGFAGFVRQPPTKPLLAAVEGYALGGGFEIALACDLIVCGRDATFGLPEVKRGLTAAAGGLFRLADRLPFNVAMELILTGRNLGAEEGSRLGLVSHVTDPGGALTKAMLLAQEISANAPLAVAASKAVLTHSRDWDLDDRFEMQERWVDPVRKSRDALEGATAFSEKRMPNWTAT